LVLGQQTEDGQPKKQTQGNGGSQKKMAATCRGTTHLAGVAQHKVGGHTGTTAGDNKKKATRGSVARGTLRNITEIRNHDSSW
jgi:hypothetical protein